MVSFAAQPWSSRASRAQEWAERLAQYTGAEAADDPDELQVEPSFAAIDSELDALLPAIAEAPGMRDPGLDGGPAAFGQPVAHMVRAERQ